MELNKKGIDWQWWLFLLPSPPEASAAILHRPPIMGVDMDGISI